jgi:replication-associated recombination protein RarA
MQLADMAFTEEAHNLVLLGGPGTGKTHLATAIAMSGIQPTNKSINGSGLVSERLHRRIESKRCS